MQKQKPTEWSPCLVMIWTQKVLFQDPRVLGVGPAFVSKFYFYILKVQSWIQMCNLSILNMLVKPQYDYGKRVCILAFIGLSMGQWQPILLPMKEGFCAKMCGVFFSAYQMSWRLLSIQALIVFAVFYLFTAECLLPRTQIWLPFLPHHNPKPIQIIVPVLLHEYAQR